MVELPPYLRVISGGAKRSEAPGAPSRASKAGVGPFRAADVGKAVTVSVQNPTLARTRITRAEADEALKRLEQQLPAAGQQVHELHEFKDRRRVLVLLAPLVNGP